MDQQRLVTLLADGGCVVSPTARRRPAGSRFADRADVSIIRDGKRNDQLFRIARGFVLKGLRGTAPCEIALLAVAIVAGARPPDAHVVKIARHAERLPDRPRR